ncbi:hypothetical protein RGT18_20980 [Solobacterium moorei]|nr:hypothetical protein RGT18_20980 [Solobacterium moorei]
MNSFRVISNVKLIASNVCTKKTTSISAHGFRLRPLYCIFSIDMSIFTNFLIMMADKRLTQ